MPVGSNDNNEFEKSLPKISVFGVGGAGVNAVNNMIVSHLDAVKFVVANTDCQSLANSLAETKIQLGVKCTKGLGAGSDPDIGRQAAEEAIDIIKHELSGVDMLFIATGLGGGTGTGASPVIAKMAHDMGILTVAIAIKPFQLEGKRRIEIANKGIADLEKVVDTIIVIDNQKLMSLNNVSMYENYAIADSTLRQAVYCVVSILIKQGFINRDFADIKTVLSASGRAIIGYGENPDAIAATDTAIHNQVLENTSISGARNILVNITGNRDLKSADIESIVNKVRNEAKCDENDEPNVIFGVVFDDDLGENIRVSVIAAGVSNNNCNINGDVTSYDGKMNKTFNKDKNKSVVNINNNRNVSIEEKMNSEGNVGRLQYYGDSCAINCNNDDVSHVNDIDSGVNDGCTNNNSAINDRYFNKSTVVDEYSCKNSDNSDYNDSSDEVNYDICDNTELQFNEDDIESDESFNLNTRSIPNFVVTSNGVNNSLKSNFSVVKKKKNNSLQGEKIAQTKQKQTNNDSYVQQEGGLFAVNRVAKKKGFFSKFMNSIGPTPFIESDDIEDAFDGNDVENNSDEDDIYDVPAIKRKVS